MSTVTKRTATVTEIAERTSKQLGLPDVKRVGVALAEIAAQEAERNRAFAERIRMLYAGLAPTRERKKMLTAFDVTLVPIKHVQGRELNPAEPLDPYFLFEVYGPAQLPTALSIFPVAKLKEGAAIVERRYPGTRPTNRGQKQALINYMVQWVTRTQS